MIEAIAWAILASIGIASNLAHLWLLAERRPLTRSRTIEREITNAFIAIEVLLLVAFGVVVATGVVVIDALVNAQRGFNWSVASDGAPRAIFTSYGFVLIALVLVAVNAIRGKMWRNMERCFHIRQAMGHKLMDEQLARNDLEHRAGGEP